jgi:tetratricopeptide (TPR) repeat protein
VAADLKSTLAAQRVERGWRFLQNDNLPIASLEFRAALTRAPAFYPAQTGQAYVALARRDYREALEGFDAALRGSNGYVPALVGRGQSLLALKREDEALSSFERALAADSTLSDLRRRVDVLRFRNLQETIEAARTAAAARRLDEARGAYQRALEASPDSAFLHRELGSVERLRGEGAAALEHYRRATELDGSDVVSLTAIGELLEARGEFAAAESAYRRAAALEPTDELAGKIAAAADAARDASLPSEFQAIVQAPQITRGDLAALIGVRLAAVLRDAPPSQVVMTDTRGHWAALWIAAVAKAGVMQPFENHTFQPGARVQRVDLAAAVRRLIMLLAATQPALSAQLSARPTITDMNVRHLSYPAAAVAVTAAVLPLLEGDRFLPGRPVSGLEAVEAIDRLKILAAGAR